MTETAKKRAAPKTAKQPETVHIAWWNRPITWGLSGLFLMLLVMSSLMGTGGPETGEAQETKAEIKIDSPFLQPLVPKAPVVKPEPTPEPEVIVRIVRVPEIVTIRTPVITADNGAVVIQGSRNVRVDRSTTINPPQRTPSKSVSRGQRGAGQRGAGQRGVEEPNAACDLYKQQHEAITAHWASLLN